MAPPIAAAPLPGDVSSEVLLRHVFDVSLTGIQLLRPVYGASTATPADFTFAYTNPAGLRISGVAEPLSGTLFERFPHTLAAGVLAYYQRAFTTDEPQPYEVNYQADGVDDYLQFQARRSGAYLLVSFTDTSDEPRSAVEEALRASQAREQAALAEAERQRGELARVFELAPVAIAVYHGPEHRIELANPVSCHLLQRPASDLLGKPLFEALPELAGHGFEQVLASVYTTGQPVLVQEQPGTHARSGQLDTLYSNLTFVPLRAPDGHISGVLSVGLDVTEQVLARQQAQALTDELEARVQERSEAARVALDTAERERNLLQAVLTQSPVAIGLFQGEELRITAANAQMAALWGRTPDQVLGHLFMDAVPELQGQGFDDLVRQVLHTQVSFFGTETPADVLRGEQVQTHYYNFVYQPLYAADGQVLGVIDVAVEVTEQVLARQQLVQLNQELEARVHERTRQVAAAQATAERERAQLQALIAQAPVAIALFEGQELRVTSANAVIAALWGYTTAHVLGRPLLEAVPELQGQGFDDLLRQVLHTQVPFSGTETPAVLLRDGQPQTSYYNFIYQPLYDAEGQVIGVLNVSTEVTEQVLARQQVEQLNAELEARVQQRTQELHAQQALLQRVLDGMPAYAATLSGPEHRVSYANAAFQRLLGDRPILGLPNADAVPEAVDQGLLAVLNQVYASGQARTLPEVPLQLPQADGTMRPHYINTTYQPLPDAQGHPQDVLAFGVDVTEQVLARQQNAALQAELLAAAQAQAQTRESFYQVFERTPALVALLRGANHQFEYVNPAYQALFTGRQLVGRAAAKAVPELFDQGFGSLLDRVYQTGETYFGLELPFTPAAPAGQPVRTSYYTFTYQALREAGVVTGVSIFAYDVTAQLQEREASAQQLRLITDSLPVLISYLDGEEIYRFVNQAYEPWFNQRAADLVGQSARAVVGEQAYRLAKPYIDRALAGEQVAFESRMPYREGFTKHIHSTFVPAKRAGVPAGFYSLIVDITEQVRGHEQVQALNAELTATNAELHQSNAQLTRTNVDLDTFVYMASHDLKAPITNIESITLALRDTLPAEVQQDEMITHLLDLLTHTTTRFQATIGQLTDLSKLQLAHAGPAEPVNLAAAIEAVRLDLLPLTGVAGVHLTIEVAPDLLVSFSPVNLRSAIYNLLSNAIKYRDPARPAQVRVRAFPAGPRVVVEVQDNGLGLNAHQQSRLFGLFQRLHTHVEGTGVGLYITKRLVENGGGTIAVASQVDVGTTFTLTFPA